MMNKPLAIADKPFSFMKTNTSKERSYYTQGQRFAARILFILWLLASSSPEGILAAPKGQMTPATTTSPGDPSLASTPPLPGGILQLSPDAPGSFWGGSAASGSVIDAALQERMSQEAAPFRERELLRTSPKVFPVEENLPFQARGGERVRFHYQMGQWRAEVSSRIGSASRRAVLPVVCSQGEDVASSLEVLSKYPSWQRQRQIHVLDRYLCPTLGEVVYVGGLGLKGGSGGEASGSGEQRSELSSGGLRSHPARFESSLSVTDLPQGDALSDLSGHVALDTSRVPSHPVKLESSLSVTDLPQDEALPDLSGHVELDASQALSSTVASESQIPSSAQSLTNQEGGDTQSLVDRLKSLAPDPQLDQQPDKLAELGAVLLKLAASKQEEAGASAQNLSPYTEAAILYQHVLSICEPKAGTLGSQEASLLEQAAYQGLTQIEISMLEQATGAEAGAITPSKPLPARIEEDRNQVADLRERVKTRVGKLVRLRDEPGSSEGAYIGRTQELFEDIAEQTKSLLANFYEECEKELEAAGIERPCKYAIMGLGSIALQQTTPYSDLEFAILMGNAPDEATAEAWRTYFRKLTHLVHFRVINLGETVLPFSEYKISLDHLGRKGLNFDLGGKTPLGRKDKGYELIQPVAGMMKYLRNEGNKMEHMDKLLPFVLERTCYIYGDQGLHNDYLAAQRELWPEKDAAGKHTYQERMMKTLLKGITELDYSQPEAVKAGRKQAGNLRLVGPKLHPDDAGKLYDVKQEIYRLPDRLLYSLAMYYGHQPKSAWDAVDQLLKDGKINETAADHLKYMASFAALLRLETYLHHGQQNEQLSLRGSLPQGASGAASSQAVHALFLPPPGVLQENGSLFKYYYTALALHREMEEFFELLNLRQEVRKNPVLYRLLEKVFCSIEEGTYFQSESFYDDSCAVKVGVYNRLLDYGAAHACAEQKLQEVERCHSHNHAKRARYHHNLALAYCHLGNYYESVNHFDAAWDLLSNLLQQATPLQRHHYERCLAKILRNRGIAHYNKGRDRFEQSLEDFEASLEKFKALYGGDRHPETAQTLLILGEAYAALENFQKSLDRKQEALSMLQDLYTGPHPEVGRALRSVGDAYAGLERFKESLEKKKASLAMFEALRDRLEVARSLRSVGEAYESLGSFSESLEQKQGALKILRGLYSGPHAEIARTLLSLGEAYRGLERFEESLDYKKQSLSMFQALYPDTHPEVAQASRSVNEAHEKPGSAEPSLVAVTARLPSVRTTTSPLPLTLIETPKHYQEAPGENTLLRKYYSKTDFPYVKSLFDEDRSRHVKDLECQLMLREKKLAKQETKEASVDREDQVASHHMRLEEVKTPIEVQDLFKARSVRPDKPIQAVHRILLTGDPGTGKTTVSRQLAYQWSVGAWGQEFEAVYLLPIRNLQQDRYNDDNYRKLNTLATAIVNNCFIPPSNEGEYERLREHIEEELKKPTTLVILDGLDERAGASEEILRQAQAGSHKLLLLSRPYGVDTERRIVTIELEHVGFNREQLEGYVRQEVSASELASALLSYIDKHANIRLIAHVPVNLQILCALWQDEDYGVKKAEFEQGSLPVLYRKFTEYTWRRYKERTSEGVSVQGREALFSKLGQIALSALEQGEVLISPGLIEDTLSNSETDADEVKARCKDAGFLLLRSIDEKFYQFPHLTFQEYFAGRALAHQFLLKDEEDRAEASEFISEHKYENQYGRTLTFMAGEVSRSKKFRGIKELLNLLEKEKERVGVQHLRLQLQVVHEWLCVAPKREVERGLSVLAAEFNEWGSCLGHWFDKAFGHIRREGYEAGSTGDKLLQLLVSSLATFGSVSVHAPDLLKPLKQAAQDYNVHVRRSALKSLGQLVSSSPSHVPSMRAILLRAAQDRDTDYVRPVGLEVLGQVVAAAPGEVQSILDKLARAAQEGDAYDRPGALAALGQVVAASPGHVLEVPETLLKATQDEHQAIRQAAVSALGQVAASAPDKAPALLETLGKAAEDTSSWSVRQAAASALGQVVASVPHEAPVILEALGKAAEDKAWPIRQAAASALGQVVAAAPHEAPVILERLSKAAEDDYWSVRQAAAFALGQVVAAVPAKAPDILEQLYQAAKDSDEDVRAAALKSLGEVLETTPRHASAMLETLLSALQDKDDDVRQAAVSALGQVAETAPDKAPAILASLRQATQDEDADVRQVALHKLPLKELLEQYFSDPSTNSILIPHITARLCHTPLVIGNKSSGEDHRQVILYATAGVPEIQNHPSDVVKDFVDRIASSASQTDLRFSCQMGKPDWERYYGAVGEEPSLPDGLEAIMDSDCPFWPGNKVRDTHMLVLIPEQVADKPLTLAYLGELIKSPKGGGYGTKYRDYYAGDIGSQSPDSSYWVLMTRDVLPGSRWKSYADQCALVSDHANRTGLPYEVPGALEAAVVMLLHHARSGERLYSDNPLTYTRCREKIMSYPVVVGGFSSGGLSVNDDCYDNLNSGVAGLRKF